MAAAVSRNHRKIAVCLDYPYDISDTLLAKDSPIYSDKNIINSAEKSQSDKLYASLHSQQNQTYTACN